MAHQRNTALAVVRELQAQGIPVLFEAGWETRGSSTFNPRGLVVHHTAGAATGDYPSLRIVRDGRSGLPGPLAQWGLGRQTVRLIAAGRANHAGSGGWRGLSGNTSVWGIEAESTGRGDWTPFQRFAYPRMAAALARHQPFPVDMICAHREWTTRKPDPTGIDMPQFRAEVARLLSGQVIVQNVTPEEDEDMGTNAYHETVQPGAAARIGIPPPDQPHTGEVWVSFSSDHKGAEVRAVRGSQAGWSGCGPRGAWTFTVPAGRHFAQKCHAKDQTVSVTNKGPEPVGVLIEIVRR